MSTHWVHEVRSDLESISSESVKNHTLTHREWGCFQVILVCPRGIHFFKEITKYIRKNYSKTINKDKFCQEKYLYLFEISNYSGGGLSLLRAYPFPNYWLVSIRFTRSLSLHPHPSLSITLLQKLGNDFLCNGYFYILGKQSLWGNRCYHSMQLMKTVWGEMQIIMTLACQILVRAL